MTIPGEKICSTLYVPHRFDRTTYQCPNCKCFLHIKEDINEIMRIKEMYENLLKNTRNMNEG